MDTFRIVKPGGRRRLWTVEGRVAGKLAGEWKCDSEEIAREVLRILKSGKAPGRVARDLRNAR